MSFEVENIVKVFELAKLNAQCVLWLIMSAARCVCSTFTTQACHTVNTDDWKEVSQIETQSRGGERQGGASDS